MVSKMKSFAVVTMAVLLTACTAVLAYFAVLKADTAASPEETTAVTTVPEKTTEAAGTQKVPEDVKTIPEHETIEIVKIKGGDPLCEHDWPEVIDAVPPAVGRVGKGISYCRLCGAMQSVVLEALPDPEKRVELFVENILQNPELPNGCEIVSLAIVLRHLGFDVDAVSLSDEYLPKGEFWYDSPYEKYIGDPKTYEGTGCYAPCIVNTANTFLSDKGSELKCYDVSGKSLDELEKYVDEGIPVIIWGTVFMDCDPTVCYSYLNSEGEEITWFAHSHCLVMIGHSLHTYIFADPLYGIADYDRDDVKTSYNQVFQQACIIK